MARMFSAKSRIYAPGSYGPYAVDGFTEADTTALQWTMSVEGWPLDRTLKLATVTMKWDNGAYQVSDIYGGPRDMSGKPLTQIVGTLYLPMEADANGNPISAAAAAGDVRVDVYVSLKTAITFTALT